MKLTNIILLYTLFTASFLTTAQTTRGLTDFPELIMADIPGAPRLSKPILITGVKADVISEGHGLAAPALYDWDGDGLPDLLIGEFGSGVEHGHYAGNFIRVYRNIGTEDKLEFTGIWDYARPPFQYKVQAHGTPYSVDQFCCIGFTPQFIDLNNDGYSDMITGNYQGEVFWFRGSDAGFLPGEPLPQEGDPRDPDRKIFLNNQHYWLYSAATFGDFTGDGKPDLIVGGRALRISENIGTSTEPKFAQRELLLDINGNPLKIYDYTKEELERFEALEKVIGRAQKPVAGESHLSPFVTDWDNDGVLDLLVTNVYNHNALAAVTFFKGVKVNNEYWFHPGIPLFTASNGAKALPGSLPRVFVTDWNNDGINDLLIGASVVTVNGQFNDYLSWNWAKDTGILIAGKDPANLNDGNLTADQMKRYKADIKLPEGFTIEDYMTIRHKGYVYVMLGSINESKPVSKKKTKTK